ncbi:50S ribosomal protein L24 [Candidatus Gracilibacteria bacterium]|nr:50S ribosomal protein L24 [Candidatus Gracilibacteria bacterium]
MKVKTNDQVVVIAGKDKGKKGKVIRVISKDNRVVVEKVNIRTKHIKKTTQKAGERIKFEASIDVSNVMVVCPSCEKIVRVGFKRLANGKKQRICKKCKDSIDKTIQ